MSDAEEEEPEEGEGERQSWIYGPRSDAGATGEDAEEEELNPLPSSPPGPPPKSIPIPPGAIDSKLPLPRGKGKAPIQRRHSVQLRARQFPPRVVGDVMTRKLIAIGEDESLRNIEDGMLEFRVRYFPVVGSDNKLLGLVSWEDVLHASASTLSELRERRDKLIHEMGKAKDVMQRDVHTVNPDTSITDAGNIMMMKHLRCVPVVDDRSVLVGLLTADDFLRLAMEFIQVT